MKQNPSGKIFIVEKYKSLKKNSNQEQNRKLFLEGMYVLRLRSSLKRYIAKVNHFRYNKLNIDFYGILFCLIQKWKKDGFIDDLFDKLTVFTRRLVRGAHRKTWLIDLPNWYLYENVSILKNLLNNCIDQKENFLLLNYSMTFFTWTRSFGFYMKIKIHRNLF